MEQKKTKTIKGKTVPYYPRVLFDDSSEYRLNIPVAKENLSLFKDIADRYKLPVVLMYGTLLGAIRENSFLKHDTDTDIAIDRKYEDVLLEIIPELEKAGLLFIRYFKIAVFNKGIFVYSFMKNEMYIDVYIMQKALNGYIIYGKKYPKKYFNRFDSISFYGHEYLIPYASESFLAYVYGADWRIPKHGAHGSPIKHILTVRFLYFIFENYLKYFLRLPINIRNILKKIIRFMEVA